MNWLQLNGLVIGWMDCLQLGWICCWLDRLVAGLIQLEWNSCRLDGLVAGKKIDWLHEGWISWMSDRLDAD